MAGIWVFGPLADAIAFALPLVVALSLAPFVPEAIRQGGMSSSLAIYNLAVAIMIDHGHVYATAIPVYLDRLRRKKLKWHRFIVPVLAMAVASGLAMYSTQSFSIALAYLAVWHICRQHYGWLLIMERKERALGLTRFQKLDRWFFVATILVPIYCWHADISQIPRKYFSDNDLAYELNPTLWTYVLPLYQIFCVVFLGSVLWRLWKEGLARAGKFLFLFITWFWFFGGIVLSSNEIFFWIMLTVCHGLSYHIHIHQYWRTPFGGQPPKWFQIQRRRNFIIYFFAITVIALVSLRLREYWLWPSTGWKLALLNMFLVCHYVFDSFIWRRGFQPDVVPA